MSFLFSGTPLTSISSFLVVGVSFQTPAGLAGCVAAETIKPKAIFWPCGPRFKMKELKGVGVWWYNTHLGGQAAEFRDQLPPPDELNLLLSHPPHTHMHPFTQSCRRGFAFSMRRELELLLCRSTLDFFFSQFFNPLFLFLLTPGLSYIFSSKLHADTFKVSESSFVRFKDPSILYTCLLLGESTCIFSGKDVTLHMQQQHSGMFPEADSSSENRRENAKLGEWVGKEKIQRDFVQLIQSLHIRLSYCGV